MEEKQIALIILGILAVVAVTGIILMITLEETGAYVYKHQPRARPGDMNYPGAQPYSNTPRNIPASQTQQDTFRIPQNTDYQYIQ